MTTTTLNSACGTPPPNTAPRATIHGSWAGLDLGPPCCAPPDWSARLPTPSLRCQPPCLRHGMGWGTVCGLPEARQRGWTARESLPYDSWPPRSAHQLALHPCNFPGPPLRQCSQQPIDPCVLHSLGQYVQAKQTGAAGWQWFVNIPEHPPCSVPVLHSTTTENNDSENPLAPVVPGPPDGAVLATQRLGGCCPLVVALTRRRAGNVRHARYYSGTKKRLVHTCVHGHARARRYWSRDDHRE